MFYFIVVFIAVAVLIMTLTWMGVQMQQAGAITTWPPTKAPCPDYWEISKDDNGNLVCIVPPAGGINAPKYDGNTVVGNTTVVVPTQPSIGNLYTYPTVADGKVTCNPSSFTSDQIYSWVVNSSNPINWDGVSNNVKFATAGNNQVAVNGVVK